MLPRLYTNIELVVLCNYIRLCIILCTVLLGKHFPCSNLISICTLWQIQIYLTPITGGLRENSPKRTVTGLCSIGLHRFSMTICDLPINFFFLKSTRDKFDGLCSGGRGSFPIRTVTVRPMRFLFCQIGAYVFNKDRLRCRQTIVFDMYMLSGIHRSHRKCWWYFSTSSPASRRRFPFNVVVRPS